MRHRVIKVLMIASMPLAATITQGFPLELGGTESRR